VNLKLEVGAITQRVSVTGTVPLLQTTEASVGGYVDQQQVSNLPLNGRDPYQLTALLPGVQPQSGFFTPRVFQETSFESNFTINGSVPLSNDVLVDGTPNIVPFMARWRGRRR
jgi:hypothetical protein